MDEMKEKRRLHKMSFYERRLSRQGYKAIAGIDEAGRGPLAGPVVAAACILPERFFLAGLNDSKQLTSEMRERLFFQIITTRNLSLGIGIVSHQRIDEINILQATFEAMQIAVSNLLCVPDMLLIDGKQMPPFPIPIQAIVRGDALSVSIAAASIIAKVTRDRLMDEEDQNWPQYGFRKHKGYGTPQHLEAIRQYGPCLLHRRSFEPVKSLDPLVFLT